MSRKLTMEQVSAAVDKARDAINVKRVYGDPIVHDGVTVIPAARVAGGGGGGGGTGPETDEGHPQGEGIGMGFGTAGKPAGAFVIKDGEARWVPAVDRNLTAILGVGVLAMLLLAARGIVHSLRH